MPTTSSPPDLIAQLEASLGLSLFRLRRAIGQVQHAVDSLPPGIRERVALTVLLSEREPDLLEVFVAYDPLDGVAWGEAASAEAALEAARADLARLAQGDPDADGGDVAAVAARLKIAHLWAQAETEAGLLAVTDWGRTKLRDLQRRLRSGA